MLVFSRKWNLQRHLNLMHAVSEHAQDLGTLLKGALSDKATGVNPRSNSPLFGLKELYKDISEIGDMQDKISNSGRAFENLNSLQSQVNSLRQHVTSCEKRYNDLVSYNWLYPRGAIQGISGYVCRKCQTFSLKMIIDPGHDMTMRAKHRCLDSADKRSYIVLPIPSHSRNFDDWAAQCLLDYINYHIPIGKYLIAKEITGGLNAFSGKLSPEIAREIFGIPDKYYYFSLENNSKISWINQAIDNLGHAIAMTDDEALDFFKKVKSTYAIFEVPVGETVRQFFMTFINYYESPQYHSDLRTIKRINSDLRTIKRIPLT
jgi:hypothetical protein